MKWVIIISCVSTNLRAFSVEVVESLLSDFSLYGTIQSLEKPNVTRQSDFSVSVAWIFSVIVNPPPPVNTLRAIATAY